MQYKILLIITGSISAYKIIDLARKFSKNNFLVNVILTKSATKFITKLTLSSLISGKLYTDEDEANNPMLHINLSRQSDIILIAPASSNFIAKISSSICDDLASNVIAANDNKKIFIAPAMNRYMLENNIFYNNLKNITNNLNSYIIEPIYGKLACGEISYGKLENIDKIYDIIISYFKKKSFFINKKIIITAGSVNEKIDNVRYIGNNSSGKQGIYLAEEFYNLSKNTILILGNYSKKFININNGNIIKIKDTKEMLDNIYKNIDNCDIFISVAAIADFKIAKIFNSKIKKQEKITLDFVKNIDILSEIGNLSSNDKRPKYVIGFAAEDNNIINNAKNKLQSKNCDLIIANDISENIFASDENKITIIDRNNNIKYYPRDSKKNTAINIIDYIYNTSSIKL